MKKTVIPGIAALLFSVLLIAGAGSTEAGEAHAHAADTTFIIDWP
ncbi:hypothetical protein ACFV4Q_21335 [Streptomyces nojiriensis]